MPSSRNFTSFNALVDGFQWSNSFSNSMVSPCSSVCTNFSSKTPRTAKGSMYGFWGLMRFGRLTCRGTLSSSVVSKACSMARLVPVSKLDDFRSRDYTEHTDIPTGFHKSGNGPPRSRSLQAEHSIRVSIRGLICRDCEVLM